MKKLLIFLLVFVMATGLFGCTRKEAPEEIAKNDVFTDVLEGAKQMSLLGVAGPISGEEMDKVVEILETVSLSSAAEGIDAEENDAYLLIVDFEDGTSKTFYVSDGMVAFNEVDGARYLISDGKAFLKAFLTAFGVPA